MHALCAPYAPLHTFQHDICSCAWLDQEPELSNATGEVGLGERPPEQAEVLKGDAGPWEHLTVNCRHINQSIKSNSTAAPAEAHRQATQ